MNPVKNAYGTLDRGAPISPTTTMKQAIHASWIVPVVPSGVVLRDHTIVIENSEIVALLPTNDWRADGDEIECRGHVLIPGLINAHTHAAMSLFRGMADDRALQIWLEEHVWPAEARFMGREFVREGTRLAAAEMLLSGTTCFNDMYFFGDETAAAALEAGIRAVIGMVVIGFPSAWAADTDEYFRKGQAIHDQYRAHPMITTTFSPHAPYTVDDDALRRIATLAHELDVPVQIHLHETAAEVSDSQRDHGERPLERLKRLGLLTPQLIAVHMTQLNGTEIESLAASGVNVAHCPESNLKLASGYCPVAALRDAGVNVALGTDGAASNNDHDMLGEMKTAALIAKTVAADARALPAAAVLEMATLNGARALGQEHALGSLEPGKQADLVAINLNTPANQPVYDPISQIVYSAGRGDVTHVWVGGKQVVANGVLATLDLDSVLSSAKNWGERISAPE